MKILWLLLFNLFAIAGASAQDKSIDLSNRFVSFRFQQDDFSLTGFTDLTTGKENVFTAAKTAGLWQLTFISGD